MTNTDEPSQQSWIDRNPGLTIALFVGAVGLLIVAQKRGAKGLASIPLAITEGAKSLVSDWMPLP